MKQFLTNLSWSFLGGGIASGVMLVLSISVGRLLGPIGYGRYSLILAISQLIIVPIVFGLDVIGARSVAMAKSKQEKAVVISATLALVGIIAAPLVVVALIGGKTLGQYFHLDDQVFNLALFLAVALGFKAIVDALIRGLGYFRWQFAVRLVEVAVAVSLFWYLFFGTHSASAASYVIVLGSSSLVVIGLNLFRLKAFLTAFTINVVKRELAYGKMIFLASVLGSLFNSLDKLIIARYLGVTELGIYGAYYTASTNFIAQLVGMFINVFFPTISQIDDKEGITTRFNRLAVMSLLPGAVIFSLFIWLILSLFGHQYPTYSGYIIGFGVLAILQVILTIYSFIITAVSQKLFQKYLLAFNLVNAGHVLFYIAVAWLGHISIAVILAGVIANTLIMIVVQRRLLASYFAKQP
jgi:O-antigen/teichoic acid export membrane protein